MDTFEPYEPEDLETLLREKSFDELLPEEQAFALKHIASCAEYESLRGLYLRLTTDRRDTLEPSPEMKNRAMAAFRAKHGSASTGRSGWLGLFKLSPWYSTENTGMRIALALLIIALIATPLLLRQDKPQLLAENKSAEEERTDTLFSADEAETETTKTAAIEEKVPSVAIAEDLNETLDEPVESSPLSFAENEDVSASFKNKDEQPSRTETISADEKTESPENFDMPSSSFSNSNVEPTSTILMEKKETIQQLGPKSTRSLSTDAGFSISASSSVDEEKNVASSTGRQLENLLKKCKVTR